MSSKIYDINQNNNILLEIIKNSNVVLNEFLSPLKQGNLQFPLRHLPLTEQLKREGVAGVPDSSRLPVTDLNEAPPNGAESNLHRYKKQDHNFLYDLIENSNAVLNKFIKIKNNNEPTLDIGPQSRLQQNNANEPTLDIGPQSRLQQNNNEIDYEKINIDDYGNKNKNKNKKKNQYDDSDNILEFEENQNNYFRKPERNMKEITLTTVDEENGAKNEKHIKTIALENKEENEEDEKINNEDTNKEPVFIDMSVI